MVSHITPSADVLDAKRQLLKDNEWLWQITIGLRQADKIIEAGVRCCRESDALLQAINKPRLSVRGLTPLAALVATECQKT